MQADVWALAIWDCQYAVWQKIVKKSEDCFIWMGVNVCKMRFNSDESILFWGIVLFFLLLHMQQENL